MVGFTGAEIEELEGKDLIECINTHSVFARVQPEHKTKIVNCLRSQDYVVAMTGDGVNDVLALKQADCSIAMASGSEAARNVSHLVLLDSNFASMPKVVQEGRRVINNIQKGNYGEMKMDTYLLQNNYIQEIILFMKHNHLKAIIYKMNGEFQMILMI